MPDPVKRLKQKADSLKRELKHKASIQRTVEYNLKPEQSKKLLPRTVETLKDVRRVVGKSQVEAGRSYNATVDSLGKAKKMKSQQAWSPRRIGV